MISCWFLSDSDIDGAWSTIWDYVPWIRLIVLFAANMSQRKRSWFLKSGVAPKWHLALKVLTICYFRCKAVRHTLFDENKVVRTQNESMLPIDTLAHIYGIYSSNGDGTHSKHVPWTTNMSIPMAVPAELPHVYRRLLFRVWRRIRFCCATWAWNYLGQRCQWSLEGVFLRRQDRKGCTCRFQL